MCCTSPARIIVTFTRWNTTTTTTTTTTAFLSRGVGYFSACGYHHVVNRFRRGLVGRHLAQFFQSLHPLLHLPEYYVLAVEIGDGLESEKELRRICVFPAVGHGKEALFGVVHKSLVLVSEFSPGISVLAVGSINRGTTPSVSGRKVSRLYAKAGDDPVDNRSEIPQVLFVFHPLCRRFDFSRAQAPKVLGRQGSLVLVQPDHNAKWRIVVVVPPFTTITTTTTTTTTTITAGEFQVASRAGSGGCWKILWLRCAVFGFEFSKELVFPSLILLEGRIYGSHLGCIVFFVEFDQPCFVIITTSAVTLETR